MITSASIITSVTTDKITYKLLEYPMPQRFFKSRRARQISRNPLSDPALIDLVSYAHSPYHCGANIKHTVNKTKCPRGITSSKALKLLQEGLRRYTFPPIEEDKLPNVVWAVDEYQGRRIVYEAKLENRNTFEYHGFPIQEKDVMWALIIEKWDARSAL